MSEQLNPPSQDEIEAEAERLRDDGDEMRYAAYCTLLWVLGYGTGPPSKMFADGQPPK